MATWSMKVEGETVNDGGRKLKVGSFPYEIISAGMVVNKSNPSGKEQQVVLEFRNGASYVCRSYFAVMSDNTQRQNIAEKELRSIVQAAGVTGVMKPELLKKLIGKFVEITAKETSKDGKTYVNIATVEAYEGDADEVEETEADEEEEAPPVKSAKKTKAAPVPVPEPVDEDEDEEEEEDEDEAPAPAAGAKKRPW